MSTTDDLAAKANSLREEVRHLFGLRWDNFVEWVIIAWSSAWLWTSWAVSNAFVFPMNGPIEWIAEVLRLLDVPSPSWLLSIPRWLTEPDRSWLLWVFIVGAAVFATLSVRSHRHTGLRVMALVCMILALEVDGSAWPILWSGLWALIPFGIALVLGALPDSRNSEQRLSSFFLPQGVAEHYFVRVLGIFAMTVVAPGVLFAALVTSYRTVVPYEPSRELARLVAYELEERADSLADVDAFTALSALVAAVSANSSSNSSRHVAGTFHFHMKRQRESRRLAERAGRANRFG